MMPIVDIANDSSFPYPNAGREIRSSLSGRRSTADVTIFHVARIGEYDHEDSKGSHDSKNGQKTLDGHVVSLR
jgi:hypothetical protein